MNAFSPRWPWWLTLVVGLPALVFLLGGGAGPLSQPPALLRGGIVAAVLLLVDWLWTRRCR